MHFLVNFYFSMLIWGIFYRLNRSPKSFKMVNYGIFHVFLSFFDQNSDSKGLTILFWYLFSLTWHLIKNIWNKTSFELSSFPFKGCSQPLNDYFAFYTVLSQFLGEIHKKTSAVKLKCTLGCLIFSATKIFCYFPSLVLTQLM